MEFQPVVQRNKRTGHFGLFVCFHFVFWFCGFFLMKAEEGQQKYKTPHFLPFIVSAQCININFMGNNCLFWFFMSVVVYHIDTGLLIPPAFCAARPLGKMLRGLSFATDWLFLCGSSPWLSFTFLPAANKDGGRSRCSFCWACWWHFQILL